MSTVTFVLGVSGTGKTSALRNLDPAQTLLIQSLPKALPFRTKGWDRFGKDKPAGNIFVTDDSVKIEKLMRGTRRKVIVLDDFQYVMSNEFMRRSSEKGYEKFTEIGRNAWEIIKTAGELDDDVRVYIVSHTEESDSGQTKMKTIGKMLDDKVCLEGMVTIVLRTKVSDGKYMFRTQNNGSDTCKSPLDMFSADEVPNDLAAVDQKIVEYYDLTATA